jgi:hypothetical protein
LRIDAYRGVNKLYKCITGGRNHSRHVMTNDLVNRMTMIEGRYPLTKLPMCEHCERAALWGHNERNEMVGVCTSCGTTTKNPLTYSEYLAQGHDLPEYVKNSEVGKEVIKLTEIYDSLYGLVRTK